MVRKFSFVLAMIFTLLLAACGQVTPGEITAVVSTAISAGTVSLSTVAPVTPGPAPTRVPPIPIPTLPSALGPTELKYRLLEKYPNFFYCDPDLYPVARGDEAELARQRFPEIQANQEEFQAILAHNSLSVQTSFTGEQKLLIYQEHKKLTAIPFELAGEVYKFQLRTANQDQGEGFYITGTIDGQGNIDEQERTSGYVACPICLAAQTRIDTPRGSVAVQNLRPGDIVWTVNRAGERVAVPVLEVAQAPVLPGHRVVHLVLDDGREVLVSPGHPTADGGRVGDLKIGDFLDGARLVDLEYVPYEQSATYDLLPSGDTGLYWANGILLGNTLR